MLVKISVFIIFDVFFFKVVSILKHQVINNFLNIFFQNITYNVFFMLS